MPELLFEIGCEEIPADDLEALPGEFERIATAVFSEQRLEHSALACYATPRRLVLTATVEARQKDLQEQRVGPPKKVAIDENGNPTKAGLGFATNVGVPFARLKVIDTPRGQYMAAQILVKGKPAPAILKDCLPQIVSRLPFKKYMHWEPQHFLFGRPIRRIVLLFGGKVISIGMAGVTSGRHTFGHRFLGKKKIAIDSFEDYTDKLLKNGVILRKDQRVRIIAAGLQQQAEAAGGVLLEDRELLHTMANEVEYPEVLAGGFSSEFLALPHDILINAMRKHQKYFCVTNSNGNLLPVFLTVLNTRASNADLIRTGHERVLQARLRDAEFFWNEDRKATLESRKPLLSRLTYHVKLGSYQDKVNRMMRIADETVKQLKQDEVADQLRSVIEVAKVDLLTLMVGEFPELQGKMAGLYAREEGYPEESWQALYDQYLPVSTEDDVPRNRLGALVSLADRLEALSAGFTLNMVPSGSRDPYALRRVATGLMKIILHYQLDLDLRALLDRALSLFDVKAKMSRPEMLQTLLELMEARFRFLMEQRGIPHDYLNAVLNVEKHSYLAAFHKLNALWAKRESGDLRTLAKAFKRINNIIYDQPSYAFNPDLLQEDGEMRLLRAFSDIEFRVLQNIQVRDYSDAVEIMVTLGPEIDNFFDEVLVMAENPAIRNNRIALLQRISEVYRRIADFSALQIEI